jgi:hypothetical protein
MRYHDDATNTEIIVNRDISSWLKNKDVSDVISVTKEAIRDYSRGAISLDDLSCILGDFYFEVMKDPSHSAELANVLETGSDLAYSERFSDRFLSDLKEVLDFAK